MSLKQAALKEYRDANERERLKDVGSMLAQANAAVRYFKERMGRSASTFTPNEIRLEERGTRGASTHRILLTITLDSIIDEDREMNIEIVVEGSEGWATPNYFFYSKGAGFKTLEDLGCMWDVRENVSN